MKIYGTNEHGIIPPEEFDPNRDFFGAEEILDDSIRHCSVYPCTDRATHYVLCGIGLHQLAITLCANHVTEIHQAVNVVHRLPECPEAEAVLERRNNTFNWVVHSCPICGGRHEHGGIPLDRDPREWLDHRMAHCSVPFREIAGKLGGYVLVEKENDHAL